MVDKPQPVQIGLVVTIKIEIKVSKGVYTAA